MIKIGQLQIVPTIFPDGTSQVWKLPEEIFRRHVFVDWEFNSESELIHLAQLHDLLAAKGCNVSLQIKCLPYARQDKEISNSETFALRTFAKLLNCINFYEVSCWDVHSDVAEKLIKNFKNHIPYDLINKVGEMVETNRVVFPDKGAGMRYGLQVMYPISVAEKTRNPLTGQITGMKLETNVEGQNILIVDDICDGGATFIQLSKLLTEKGAKSVNLYVTHGIFSKGLEPLLKAGIKRIFTMDGEAKCHRDPLYPGGLISYISYKELK
jgi:ribose-phosphate pyrophosphokinase